MTEQCSISGRILGIYTYVELTYIHSIIQMLQNSEYKQTMQGLTRNLSSCLLLEY